MPAIRSAVVADVVAATEKLRADDAVLIDPEMMLGDVSALLDAVSALQSVAVRRLRAARAVDATGELYGRSPKRWLVEEELLAGVDASRLVRLVHELPLHPLTQTAYENGEISTAHAAAILSALRSLPAGIRDTVEPHLVEHARCSPPEEIAGFVDALLDRLGLDTAADVRRERRYAERGVDLASTMHGNRVLSGTLTPDVGERLDKALALAARAGGADDDRTLRQRQHDALGEIADAYLAAAAADGPSFAGAPRAVLVTMDLETLEGALRRRWIELPSGARIDAETARRLACDAAIIPVVLGSRGEVLDIGQADHEFSTAIRRAAWVRDGGRCAFPGCRNNAVELHHLVFRRHGGPTSLQNAAWLCGYHHHLAHEGGWTLRRATHGGYLWTGPHGHQRERRLDSG